MNPIAMRDSYIALGGGIKELEQAIISLKAQRAEIVAQLATEGFQMIGVESKTEIKPEDWPVGARLRYVGQDHQWLTNGSLYKLRANDRSSVPVCIGDDDGSVFWTGYDQFEFVSEE